MTKRTLRWFRSHKPGVRQTKAWYSGISNPGVRAGISAGIRAGLLAGVASPFLNALVFGPTKSFAQSTSSTTDIPPLAGSLSTTELVATSDNLTRLSDSYLNFIITDAGPLEIVLTAGLVGAVVFAATTGVGFIRVRRKGELELSNLKADMQRLRAEMDRTETLLASDIQRQLIWPEPGKTPILYGKLPADSNTPKSDSGFLAFGSWLDTGSAALLDECIANLQRIGQPFGENLKTRTGAFINCTGRVAGGKPAVCFRAMTGEREELARLSEDNGRMKDDLETAQSLLEAAPGPAWIRRQNGQLVWVNAAYAEAVGLASRDKVLDEGVELLDAAGRTAVRQGHAAHSMYSGRLPVVVNGKRQIFDLTDIDTKGGSGGLAVDMTELEVAHGELKRTIDSHERTLNQLQSAVAIFGPDHTLQFYNDAYKNLWALDASFLDSAPLDSDVLDALRERRQLPEQADFRRWKTDLLAAYRESDGIEDRWHLPDGRVMRVIANPHPQGGVTYVFENITEQMKLESRFNALAQVQGETLDNLSEGVAVFGSGGRLTLWNPAFTELWSLDENMLVSKPHVSVVIKACKPSYENEADWNELLQSIAGVDDARRFSSKQMSRADGKILAYGIVPLPDGGTLVTFTDVTASVNEERALREKTDALEEAHAIKNTFLQHVSYEMRSPLTNIIGFAQLLSQPRTGELTDKQREYADYILSSSSALLAIINDVLDLATVDAGIMELDLVEIDVKKTLDAVTEAVQDRLAETDISLETSLQSKLGGFVADEKRLRQILFNLVTNAIRFSDSGCTVKVSCEREDEQVVFVIADDGLGISQEILESVFGRFISHGIQNRRRSAGLGLSIVKSFVELHGGTVNISSEEGAGTTVRCAFPHRPVSAELAAE